jgi:hypothetical protein
MGKFGSSISITDRIALGGADTYAYYNDVNIAMDFYVQGFRGMSIVAQNNAYGGGNLHGVWYSDHILLTSDRRLKKNIKPLITNLNSRAEQAGATEGGPTWVLRQLRPVSFQFKRGPETKLQRFGFIADDVQATIPDVVREREDAQRHKGIFFEDLLAVLTLAMQTMQQKLEGTDIDAQGARQKLATMEARLERVEQAVAQHTNSLKEGLKAIEAMIASRLPYPGAQPRQPENWQDGRFPGSDRSAFETTHRWAV